VVLAGEGGQGLVTAGILLAEAASIQEGKCAVQTQSYGISARGGMSKSEVLISNQEIIYPGVEAPDLILVLTQEAYDTFISCVSPETTIVYDTALVVPWYTGVDTVRTFGFPFTEAARELGRVGTVNMVALGSLVALTGIVRVDSLINAIGRHFPEGGAEYNQGALHRGIALTRA